MEIILDGRNMTDRRCAQAEIAEKLSFPDYYGHNLDALWDLLTEGEEREICLIYAGTMLKALGGYGAELLKTFYEAAEETDGLQFRTAGETESFGLSALN